MCIMCFENINDSGSISTNIGFTNTCINVATICPRTSETVFSWNVESNEFNLIDEVTNLSGDSVPNENGDLIELEELLFQEPFDKVSVNPTSSNIQHAYFKNEKDSNVEDDIPAKITIIADERSDEELVKNGEWNLVSENPNPSTHQTNIENTIDSNLIASPCTDEKLLVYPDICQFNWFQGIKDVSDEMTNNGTMDMVSIAMEENDIVYYPSNNENTNTENMMEGCTEISSQPKSELNPETPENSQHQQKICQSSETLSINKEVIHHQIPPYSNFNVDDDDEENPIKCCKICGDMASGFHYGVSSCEACKAFFKRTIQGKIVYCCPASNKCAINKRRRKACQACRFQKCLKMGMLKEGVRLDRVRGGRQKYCRLMDNSCMSRQKPVITLGDNELLNSMIACEPKTILALPKGLRSESSFLEDGGVGIIQMLSTLYDKQLSGIVDWVKEIPGFTDFSLNDQMRLLQGSWSEILTLSLVFGTMPTTVGAANAVAKKTKAGLKQKLKFAPDFALSEAMALQINLEEFYGHCINILDRSNNLGLRREEFLILKVIILSNVQIEDDFALRKFRENTLTSLHECVSVIRSGNAYAHVQNLLLLLPLVSKADAMFRLFWKKIHKDQKIPLEKFMVEMLDVSKDCICMQKLKSKKKY